MPEHLTEHVADWRSAVVVERGTQSIRNVALAGTESKNGYRYQAAALQTALPLYENTPVFLDHPTSVQRPRDRSARDLAGSVTNVRFEGGRLRGDIRTLDTEAGRTLLALAEADGPGVGMSHVVLAERSADGSTVERIVEVISVDAVVFPATTRTFRESVSDDDAGLGSACGFADRDAALVPVPLSLGRGVRGAGSASTFLFSDASPDGVADETMQTAPDTQLIPSPPAPLPREKGDESDSRQRNGRIDRVKRMMNDSCQRRTGVSHPTEQHGSAKQPASSSGSVRSAPTSRLRRPGSLERLLASVDAQLPGHLRRLAAAPGAPGRGRGVRVGVFPTHVVVEWRSVAGLTEHYAVPWHLDGCRIVLGDALIPIDEFAEPTTWRDVLSKSFPSPLGRGVRGEGSSCGSDPPLQPRKSRSPGLTNESRQTSPLTPGPSPQGEGGGPASTPSHASTPSQEDHHDTHANLEQLAEQLRQTAAERDRLAARLAERSPTSLLRRPMQRDPIADAQFVQAIKRR